MFILVFIIILAVLVLVHEFGHFVMAKRAGMKVEEFGFGFPPRLFGKKKGETVYSVNAIPLGGFVRILGENNEGEADPRSFINKGFWQRFSTLIAGVVMNVILAWFILSILSIVGVPSIVIPGQQLPPHAVLKNQAIAAVQVQPGTPADKAGVSEGDQIVAIDGQRFNDAESMVGYIKSQTGHDITISIQRGTEHKDVSALVRQNPPAGEGALGIGFGSVGEIQLPWYMAPWYGVKALWELFSETIVGFYHIIVAGQGLSALGGPVKIAALTNQVTKLGFAYVMNFAAVLSINLAIINILPFPALDGGRILFLIIEKIRGKRNNQRIEQWANAIGFALLIALVIVISVRDVRSLFGR